MMPLTPSRTTLKVTDEDDSDHNLTSACNGLYRPRKNEYCGFLCMAENFLLEAALLRL